MILAWISDRLGVELRACFRLPVAISGTVASLQSNSKANRRATFQSVKDHRPISSFIMPKSSALIVKRNLGG
jgi:hypothetical protein